MRSPPQAKTSPPYTLATTQADAARRRGLAKAGRSGAIVRATTCYGDRADRLLRDFGQSQTRKAAP